MTGPAQQEPLDAGLRAADLTCRVVTVSTRAAAGVYEDLTGPLIVAALTGLGTRVQGPVVVADGDPVEQALHEAVAAGVDAVITTGGTGFTPTDRTPEMTRRVLDLEIPGMSELLRARGVAAGMPLPGSRSAPGTPRGCGPGRRLLPVVPRRRRAATGRWSATSRRRRGRDGVCRSW